MEAAPFSSLFAVIRHGERADHVGEEDRPANFTNSQDPPLTAAGL